MKMKMNVWHRRAIVTLVLALLVLLAGAAVSYQILWNRYDAALQQLEPRSERFEGIVQAGSEIETLLASASSAVTPWLYSSGESAQNEVQQQLRQIIDASGSTLVSSQIALEPAGENKLARIRITATVAGEWAKLVHLMESLQAHRPPFWVRSANIVREGASAGAGPQNGRLTLQLEAPLAPEKAKP